MAKPKETDVLILGAGISGLTLAALLEKAGLNYLIVDSQEEVGGLGRALEQHGFLFDYGMKSVPVGININQNPLIQIKEELGLDYGIEPWTEPALVFEKGEFKPFVGFGGSLHTTEADELAYYAQSPRLTVSGGLGKLVAQLKSKIPKEKIRLQSSVTSIKAQDEKITEIILNGEEIIRPQKAVSTLAPNILAALLPSGLLNPRTHQRMTTRIPFASVSLDLATEKKISELKNMLFLSEVNDNPLHMVGIFITNTDPIRTQHKWQVSSWMSLVDPELVANDEAISKVIRSMKKLLNRAFPKLLASVKWERILAIPSSIGPAASLQLEKNGTLPGVDNLYLAGSHARTALNLQSRNLLAAIDSARTIANLLVTLRPEKAESLNTQPPEPVLGF